MNQEHLQEAIKYLVRYQMKRKNVKAEGLQEFMATDPLVPELVQVIETRMTGMSHDQSVQLLSELATDMSSDGKSQLDAMKSFFLLVLFLFAVSMTNNLTSSDLPAAAVFLVSLAVPLLFVAVTLLLLWKPRRAAMKKISQAGWQGTRTIDEMMAVAEMPLLKVIGRYHRKFVAVVFVAAVLICSTMAISKSIGVKRETAFQEKMADIMYRSDFTGDRYVVFDEDDQRYLDGYLPAEVQAETAEDLRYIFLFRGRTQEVQGFAKRMKGYYRILEIELMDLQTNECLMTERLYGSRPVAPTGDEENDGGVRYGRKPQSSEIAEKLEEMIRKTEGR